MILKRVATVLLLTGALFATSCEKHAPSVLSRITVKNNSQISICPYIPDMDRLAAIDTNLPSAKPKLTAVSPNGETYYDLNQDWGSVFRNAGVETVSFYFVDSAVYFGTNWQQISDSNLILKRSDYSVDELEASGWVVSYP